MIYKIILIFSTILFSQEYIDIIQLKNGQIIKGKIIENVPNKYCKIQSGNNLFLLDVDRIESIVQDTETEDLTKNKNVIVANPQTIEKSSTNKNLFGFRIGIDPIINLNTEDFYNSEYTGRPSIVIGYDTFINKSKGFGIGFEFMTQTKIDDVVPDIGFEYDIEIDILSFYTFYSFKNVKLHPFIKAGYSLIGYDFIYDYNDANYTFISKGLYTKPDLMYGIGFIINKLQVSYTEHSSTLIDGENYYSWENMILDISKINLSFTF